MGFSDASKAITMHGWCVFLCGLVNFLTERKNEECVCCVCFACDFGYIFYLEKVFLRVMTILYKERINFVWSSE